MQDRFSSRVRNAWNVAERTRIGVTADRGSVRARVTLQDARALGVPGSSAIAAGDRATFGPYEAFGEVHSSAERPAYLRFGRQAVEWGEGRLLGKADFSPTGRSLDAIRGHLAAGSFDVEALAAMLEPPRPLGSAFGDTSGGFHAGVSLYGLLGRYTLSPLFHVELYGLARVARSNEATDGSRFQAARSSGETYTSALRFYGDDKGFRYGVEGAYQLGRTTALASSSTDVAAYAVSAHVSKTLPDVLFSPTFRVSGAYASGDDRGSTYRQFDPLLADPQRFHGIMDTFAWSNLADVGGNVDASFARDTTFSVGYRYARLAQTSGEWIGSYLTAIGRVAPSDAYLRAGYRPADPSPNGELGHEIDVTFAWKPVVPLEFRLAWSGLVLGDAARAIMSAEARGATQPDAQSDGVVAAPTFAQYAYVQAALFMN